MARLEASFHSLALLFIPSLLSPSITSRTHLSTSSLLTIPSFPFLARIPIPQTSSICGAQLTTKEPFFLVVSAKPVGNFSASEERTTQRKGRFVEAKPMASSTIWVAERTAMLPKETKMAEDNGREEAEVEGAEAKPASSKPSDIVSMATWPALWVVVDAMKRVMAAVARRPWKAMRLPNWSMGFLANALSTSVSFLFVGWMCGGVFLVLDVGCSSCGFGLGFGLWLNFGWCCTFRWTLLGVPLVSSIYCFRWLGFFRVVDRGFARLLDRLAPWSSSEL
ncbi:hypothetical protein M5K25_000305 [Dendrobium thyrsiflorum]|uniref:Transmembrane protein n=1 Tax=Dendrobium thyrsiflorum TaxID=117978 RepID=A0ABD0VTM0_DENTH